VRLCSGVTHAEGCHHELYMRQGVERFLAHPRTMDALTLALSQDRPIHPEDHARRILLYLAKVSEQLDGIDCGTPVVERLTGDEVANVELPAPGDLVGLVDFLERVT
jgi:hypothetical protein